ncbi:MAG: oligosaccharide flippase family protein [Flavobacteriales bacterium]
MNIKEFISAFLKRSGAKMFNAMVLAKVIGFLVSIAMARILTQESYGDFTYAFTAVSFLVPFMGFGAYQSLVYFGARLKTEEEKRQLFKYAFSRGIILSAVLSALLLLFSPLITINRPNSQFLLVVLSLHVLTFTLVEFVRNYTRLVNRNDLFAKSENWYNALLLVLAVAGALVFGVTGYAWALVITPLIIGIYYLKKLNLSSARFKSSSPIQIKDFWKYGLFVSIGAVAAKMMYIVDIITIGNILSDSKETLQQVGLNTSEAIAKYVSKQTAVYRVCSIIPIASFVLPLALITTDFVKVSENAADKKFLSNYALNTMKLLFPISLAIAAVLHFGSEWILWIFGEEYQGHGELISVFALAVIGAFTLRIPFGNLLSAVGKANWNAYISFGVLGLNVVLNYYLVGKMGVMGAAWATTILIWVSGVVNYVCYRVYVGRLK